jgi:hypothetical protein
MTPIHIKVILDAAHSDRTDQFCQSLTALGMTVEQTVPEIGVIFGSADPALLPRMQAMDGVIEAVAEGTMRAIRRD